MDFPLDRIIYKPSNMSTTHGYPNTMPKEYHKWLPKFIGNNVVIHEEHIDSIVVAMEYNSIEHGDVTMKLLAMSLNENAKKWYKGLPDNHLESYEAFANFFKGRWTKNKYSGMILMKFNQIKKKEKETVKEFYARFENFHNQILNDLCSP
jgi:hypothetical protein